MLKPLFSLSVVASLALAAPTLAQEAAQADGQQPATGLDMGTQVSDGPQLGERYSREKHGDWDIACLKTETETDPCSMLQVLTDQSGNPIAEYSMFRLKEGGQAAAAATVVVPLETLLPAQLTIGIDDNPAKRYQYTFCNPIGCVAQIGLTQQDVDLMKKGSTATLSLYPAPAPDQKIDLTLSLTGFTAAFDVVDVVTQ